MSKRLTNSRLKWVFDRPITFELHSDRQWWLINDVISDGKHYQQWLIDNGMDIKNLTEEDRIFITLAYRGENANKNSQ